MNSLDLSNNYLTDVCSLKDLISLTTLNLNNNQLAIVECLKDLTNLISLDLGKNNLKSLRFLKELPNLTSLKIYENPNLTNTIKVNLPENKYHSFYFPLNDYEINQIKNYYKQLEEGEAYIYEARVLVVGEPKAGKTTLTQKVKDNKKWNAEMKGKELSQTVGVVIDTLPFSYHKDSSKQITAHLWDFGGQEIQYVLHQYFFTERSLYVLLADGRKELPNFNYWFEIIATLGRNCPVLVVLNENGGKPVKTFNINEYRDQFGNYLESIEERSVNFYDDSDGKFDKLKAEIEHKTSNLRHIGSPLPKTWVDVRKELEKLKAEKSYIEKDEFLKVCEKCNLTNKDYIAQVIDYLHDLGIALNYKNDSNLSNKFILQPNWVIDALYIVLQDNKIEMDCGMFEVSYVDSLWEKEGYSPTDCDILLGLMQKGKFEIAYKLKENKFIVPILLPYKPAVEYKLDVVNEIQTIIEYKFMPKGIVPRLIVRLHKSILLKEGQQVVWNKGVLLSHHNSTAEVIEKEQSKQISIKVSGENSIHNKEILTIIRNEIVGIHYEWFDNHLKYEELVPCVCDVCKKAVEKQFYRLSVLENALMKGKDIQCQTSFESVNTRELVEGIYIVSINKTENRGSENILISRINNSNINIISNKDIQNSTIDSFAEQTNSYNEINKKLIEMIAKLDEKQTQELSNLTQKLIELIDEKFVEAKQFNDEQVEEFEEVKRKYSNETKLKIKQTIPFEWFIKQFTGFSVELEKEFKTSKEIDPNVFIAKFRNLLYGANIEENLLRLRD